MSNHPKTGAQTARVAERHGRKGHVCLSTSVPEEMKTHLVEQALHRGTTLKAEIEEALRRHLYEVAP